MMILPQITCLHCNLQVTQKDRELQQNFVFHHVTLRKTQLYKNWRGILVVTFMLDHQLIKAASISKHCTTCLTKSAATRYR